MDIEKILNKRSNAVVTDGGVENPVKPTSSQLDNGEIAVNYHKGTERLFIKNDNEEVVEFVSKDEVEANYYDKDDTDTLLATKANTADLAEVAISGSYNDLSDKPTIQELATVKHVYALDSTNPDYPNWVTITSEWVYIDKTCDFGEISIITITPEGTEVKLTDTYPQSYSNAETTIDNTTYTSYYYNSRYYLGLSVPFFKANVAQYENDYTFGVIKFTSTQNGVFKVHAIGVKPSTCTITVNGVTTASLDTNIVAVQVNTGDVVKVITTSTVNNYVQIIGFVLEGNCGVSVFVNDAGYLTAHQDITGKADKVSNSINGNFAALDSNGNLIDSGHKHSDYQASLVSGTNIKTINGASILTSGDLTVLTSTTDSVTSGSTTPITSGGVYTALQNYEKKLSFTSVSSLPTTCVVNTYYRITSSKTSLAITLPSSSLTAGDTIGISFTAGSSITTPTISNGTIYKQDGWSDFFKANATYEIVALYDGGKWLVTSTKFNS